MHTLGSCQPKQQHYYWSLLYSAILRSWADSLRSHVILHEWIAFYSAFLNIHRSGVLTALAWLVPQESAARESQSRRVLCIPYNHSPCHFMQSHIRKVYACLAVTCHLRFWQNDRGLLRATAVTRGWNGYWNKSQHRKFTLEKKIIPQGFEPATFRSRVRRSNHWAIPAPRGKKTNCDFWQFFVCSVCLFLFCLYVKLLETKGAVMFDSFSFVQFLFCLYVKLLKTKRVVTFDSFSFVRFAPFFFVLLNVKPLKTKWVVTLDRFRFVRFVSFFCMYVKLLKTKRVVTLDRFCFVRFVCFFFI